MINKWLEKLLHLEDNEREVEKVKADAQSRVDEVTAVLRKQGRLQRSVIQKTTTFYLARALGVIK